MKNVLRNRLMWLIPVMTTICSIAYIGLAVKQEKTTSFQQNEQLKEIAFFQNANHIK